MVFSSLTFLFCFLPLIIIIYYLSPKKARNTILFLSSLIFYAWGEPIYILIMLFSTFFDYINGLLIEKYKFKKDNAKARKVLLNSIIVNLGILCFFKYSNFLIENVNSIFDINISLLNIGLPIGISFYTFQTMSYTIDVYLGKAEVQKNIIDFGCYVTFFPQLVAGPIVKYKDISNQLINRKENLNDFVYGLNRLSIGLFKKVVLANNIGYLWTEISNIPTGELSILTAWFGAICFTFQIYFDFSGYSDMAIGLGKLFGFTLPENFDHPYQSRSITEFWRVWHISLSSWFKEYVYIPLGGSQSGTIKLIRNLLIVWFLTGLWHGASWNFIIWGLYFGIILIIEKLLLLKYLKKLPQFFQHIYTLFLIVVSWVIFSIEDLTQITLYLKAMFGFNNSGLTSNYFKYLLNTHFILIVICFIFSLNLIKIKKLKNNILYQLFINVFSILLFLISVCFLVGNVYNPFLYFRF